MGFDSIGSWGQVKTPAAALRLYICSGRADCYNKEHIDNLTRKRDELIQLFGAIVNK